MDRIAVVRSMSTKEGDHGRGSDVLDAYRLPAAGAVQYPTLGALTAKEAGRPDR